MSEWTEADMAMLEALGAAVGVFLMVLGAWLWDRLYDTLPPDEDRQ